MDCQPGREHNWLGRMAGEWNAEIECVMGPEQPPVKSEAVEVVRSLGGFWVVAEGRGESRGIPEPSRGSGRGAPDEKDLAA